jgi:asparagine synthase (glutamine-hydrolysing)
MTPPRHDPRVFDLTDTGVNRIYNMPLAEARSLLARGDPGGVGRIDGSFALVARDGLSVRMARTIDRPMRFFLAKREAGPALVVADRIDRIHAFLEGEGLAGQFHPSYTRMVPAHHVLEVSLTGCPDPSPAATRFFTPERGTLPGDLDAIADRYVGAAYAEVVKWLRTLPPAAPIGVAFSGGVDSGAILILIHHALGELGLARQRLKAFTLAVDGGGPDVDQAWRFLDAVGLSLYGESVEVAGGDLDVGRTLAVIEDYKPLDVQCAAALLALLSGIRSRYPEWVHIADGDGGDENLKDYPIEENPELTITSVLGNPLLYQEGWGVGALKHSLTYSGGQSRSYVRTYAPARALGFAGFSPFTLPAVIGQAEAIPFAGLTGGSVAELYRLKGEVVSRGVRRLTGLAMPVFPKRRFQRGAVADRTFDALFGTSESAYRRRFHALYA